MKEILKLLGLGQKARSVTSGDEGVRAKLERRKVKLVIIASDAAASTKQDFSIMCRRYGVPYIVAGLKNELGAAIGKSPRAVVALLDKNLADKIREYLEKHSE
ncbi:MAG: ribosomal L7Ae/L30e/S12e/Gadd45 family protein [Peptococcaceae bacterium]|nr:ribosomal L7Ae/L30e/S12e/Gadd45 family protein [Peptococcaceae bacterium]